MLAKFIRVADVTDMVSCFFINEGDILDWVWLGSVGATDLYMKITYFELWIIIHQYSNYSHIGQKSKIQMNESND